MAKNSSDPFDPPFDPTREGELSAIRRSNTTGLPLGERAWVTRLAKPLNLNLAIRPRGRPKKHPAKPPKGV